MNAKKLTRGWVSNKLPERPKSANKGTFGKILVIAGSEKYPGAAYLSSAACYRVGAGLVTLVTDKEVKMLVSPKLPEVTFLPKEEALGRVGEYDVLLIGPGLGQDNQTIKFIEQLLDKKLPPAVIDGDGLNILSQVKAWWKKIKGQIILTPHPGEMSRLSGLPVEEIQKDRVNIAQKYANEWEQTVVLKGANTVIASSFGEILISSFENPLLATAGTGDILAGIIAGLLAQGLKPFDAGGVGVYVHGLTGQNLAKKLGSAGMLAGDLLTQIPLVLKELR